MSDAPTPPEELHIGASSATSTFATAVRRTLAISRLQPNESSVLTAGDGGFADEVARYYHEREGAAADDLVALKHDLRKARGNDFWSVATRGIAGLLGAQYAFVSKRHDGDHPPLGEPSSSLTAMSIYFNDGEGTETEQQNTEYSTHNSPCGYMKHDRVLLIPERMSEMLPTDPSNPNKQPEAYLAVPLSVVDPVSGENIVFAHFGAMWTARGLEKRTLSFAFAELLLHGISDLILDAFIGRGLAHPSIPIHQTPNVASDKPTKSLKPFAKHLSHELRTPMQGVVGMLDIMHGTVQDACEEHMSSSLQGVLHSIKKDIEVVQDSARRAVEAADNIVLAYDMNMGELHAMDPVQLDDEVASPQLLTPANATPTYRVHKRVRSNDDGASDSSSKTPRLADRLDTRHRSSSPRLGIRDEDPAPESIPTLAMTVIGQFSPAAGQTNIRSTVQGLVKDVVNGGRPESAITRPIDGGEETEVRQLNSNGEEKSKLVKWSVATDVPEIIHQDERELYAIISRILQNAFKFTDIGSIELTVQLAPSGRGILITVSDTGIGIPAAFMPKLFKAFSKEDDGIDSRREGLGLGLMVAKGMVRRLKGDMKAVRSATEGPDRGTVFEIRIPITPGDSVSTPGSPGLWTMDADRQRSFTPTHRRAFSTPPVNDVVTPACQSENAMAQDDATGPPRLQPPPVHISHPPDSRMSLASQEPEAPPPGSLAARLPLCILVVEDNPLLRAILVRMLHRMGYRRVLQAHDGRSAVALMARLRRQRRRGLVDVSVDVVLMDLWMPCMNGYDAAGRIWDLADGRDVGREFEDEGDGDEAFLYAAEARPVILAVTADVTDTALDRVARAGMLGPLTKPYSRVDLERCLLNFCTPERRLQLA